MVSASPKRGDVVWARFDAQTEGHEQRGPRPVLVLSVDGFNAKMQLVVCICLTTKSKYQSPLEVEVSVTAGKRSFALPGQVRTFSVRRLGAVIGRVSEAEIQACLDALMKLCGRAIPMKADNDG